MLIGALLAPPASYLLHCQPWPPSLHEAGLCHLAWTPLAGALAAVVVLLWRICFAPTREEVAY
jgi:hypothetical protein